MANLNREIDAIRSKEGSQGGLTQGQQTQVARNEQRIEAVFSCYHSSRNFSTSSAVILCDFLGRLFVNILVFSSLSLMLVAHHF
jgi:hypothetical protein